ncbi:hypothetical protein [Desulforhopalus singaporensis]|uniref:Restriction endonuclease n=1 Tax=Desulforhopalus singaporensis TaxID=91360 RepID=A0A1H0NRD5_9BACT|nr:hypothetical protein [Desulforhopalus singaporensis]SDO95015.1 hypothetical protein SAMN05660330_01406 [Desulforhopalus singaporensis]
MNKEHNQHLTIKYNKFIEGIKKTGFGLEYSISRILMDNDWTVINNKYYIDDVQGVAREIDILAYKVSIKKNIQIYTVLIISCKKNIENAWALLAKSKNIKDPNIDWYPVTVWTNHKIIKLMIDHFDWKKKYISKSKKLLENLFSSEKHIFAFQEMSKSTGSPKNDKNIFNSIVSSMKSQNYEIESLKKRKEQDAVYNFNLISIVDAPLVRIEYDSDEPTLKTINSDIYIGSYIINKKETISRVHFINAEHFPVCLPTYDSLHSHNVDQTFRLYNSYFDNCVKNELKVKLFEQNFNQRIRWCIYSAFLHLRNDNAPKYSDIHVNIRWDDKKGSIALSINGVYDDEELEFFNNNEEIKIKILFSLKHYYQYTGDIYFESYVPF